MFNKNDELIGTDRDTIQRIREKYKGFEVITKENVPMRRITDSEYEALANKYKKKSYVLPRTLGDIFISFVIALIFIIFGAGMVIQGGDPRLKRVGI